MQIRCWLGAASLSAVAATGCGGKAVDSTASVASPAVSTAPVTSSPARRTLRVSLYPYIPDAGQAAFVIEKAFETRYPEVNLEISYLGDTYYEHAKDGGGILYSSADVYEMDSIFLADFIKAGKIQPLGEGFAQESANLMPLARDVATLNGKLMGMPHWVCGNFLFYRADDLAFAQVKTLSEIEKAIGTPVDEPRWLIADFKGKSTLGEMYLDGAMDQYGTKDATLSKIQQEALDLEVVDDMKRIVKMIRPTFGRNDNYHDATGFYARQFSRGAGRAFVGYSEALYYAISESMLSCRTDENCLKKDQIKVTEWPLDDRGSHPIAWVDMLVMDAALTGDKRNDAEHFIRFMAEPSTYKLLLVPAWGNAPRYLMPARDDLYQDPDITKEAILYPTLRALMDKATTITADGLNERLRKAGKAIDGALPAEH